jgi:surface protein
MFNGAKSFNQNIGNWNTSNARRFNGMFANSYFNQDISNWNTSKLEYIYSMFDNDPSFNQDISKWDVSKVQNMYYMFNNATSFNQPNIGNWNYNRESGNRDRVNYMIYNCGFKLDDTYTFFKLLANNINATNLNFGKISPYRPTQLNSILSELLFLAKYGGFVITNLPEKSGGFSNVS